MSTALKVLLIILVILVVALIVLYFVGKRLQKRQNEQQEQMEAAKQTVSMLVIDKKIMPGDKLKCIGKAFGILQNSIKFSSGEKELGIDDTLKPLIYVVIKAKPENIFSNYNYCRLYFNKT